MFILRCCTDEVNKEKTRGQPRRRSPALSHRVPSLPPPPEVSTGLARTATAAAGPSPRAAAATLLGGGVAWLGGDLAAWSGGIPAASAFHRPLWRRGLPAAEAPLQPRPSALVSRGPSWAWAGRRLLALVAVGMRVPSVSGCWASWWCWRPAKRRWAGSPPSSTLFLGAQANKGGGPRVLLGIGRAHV